MRVGHQPRAGGDRQIYLGCRPIGVTGSVKGERARHQIHASDAGGRFDLCEGGSGKEGVQKKESVRENGIALPRK